METAMNTLQRINKIYNNTLTVSPHFETTVADRFLECVRSNPLFATFEESHLMFIFLFFYTEFFVSLLLENLLHFHRFFYQDFIFKLNSKLNIFNVKK